MKLKFTIQPYQTEAVESVISVFAGSWTTTIRGRCWLGQCG